MKTQPKTTRSGNKKRGSRESSYPFAAIVGGHAAKRALLMLAIEPGLNGALIASEKISEAQEVARSFAALLSASPTSHRATDESARPFVAIPVNVDESSLLGSIDLEQTLATGKREVRPGLLAAANGGVLFVGDVNLLDPSIANHIAHAIDRQVVVLEREGVSALHPARFKLLSCFNPADSEPHSLLTERLDLIVISPEQHSAGARADRIGRRLRFESDRSGFVEELSLETAEIKALIRDASLLVANVRVSREQRSSISRMAIQLGVQSSRADLAAIRAARANAALSGRDYVDDEDIVVAIQLVLAPRATKLPSEPPERSAGEPPQTKSLDESVSEETDSRESGFATAEDVIIRALDAPVPVDFLSPRKSEFRRSRAGKHPGAATHNRGRYVRSAMRRSRGARIAIDATLRAASPFQLIRRSRDASVLDLASVDRRVRVEPGDLRYKQLKHRSGMLFILAVDASGSMAANRMAQAKGALTRLLGRAYVYRDKVALISFRGRQAEVLLAPTRSVDLAKRLVDWLPSGGGTPISAGILKAAELARMARMRGISQSMLVLFTDGRANVGLHEGRVALSIEEELRRLGRLLHSDGVSSVVVDTKSKFVNSGEGRALAQMLGAKYLYLPRFDAGSLQRNVYAFAESHRD